MKRYFLCLVLSPLLLLFACTPADQDGIDGDVDTLGAAIDRELTEFRAEADESLMDIDMRLDSLEVWAEAAGENFGEEVDSTLASLREKRDSVQQDLQQLEMTAEEGAEDMRADIERELDELEEDVAEAWNRYARDEGNMDAM